MLLGKKKVVATTNLTHSRGSSPNAISNCNTKPEAITSVKYNSRLGHMTSDIKMAK
jgi:hypothetical protein